MKVITLYHPHEMAREQLPPSVMALGYFDGVHLGHQQVIKEAKQYAEANGLVSAVMTFDPHPSVVLGRDVQQVKYITPVNDKIALIEQLGIDYLFIVRFTDAFAKLLPQQYIDQYIIGLNVQHVVAGYDYTYGRMGKGTTETMPFHSRNAFTQTVVPKLACSDSLKISSTLIRSKITEGKMAEIPGLLGRFHKTTGTVVHGDNRGRTLGFPTANVQVFEDYILPPVGVYAVRAKVNGIIYNGVCNVGYVPTFNDDSKPLTIEVHVFQFDKSIYGQTIEIEWHDRLRTEKKFTDVEQLKQQISEDKRNTIAYFDSVSLADF